MFLAAVPGFLLLYLATPTANYYWDGITFALQIEKTLETGQSAYLLFHQNHLIYNAACYLLLLAARTIFPGARALDLLQATNGFVAALALAVAFRTANRLTRNPRIAAVCSAGIGVSAVWWKLATDANAYLPSLLLALICIDILLRSEPRVIWAAIALGGAMLLHQLTALIYPAAVCAILFNRNYTRRVNGAVEVVPP